MDAVGVTLTSAGAQLLPYAERIGRLMDEAKQAATDGPVPRGRIGRAVRTARASKRCSRHAASSGRAG